MTAQEQTETWIWSEGKKYLAANGFSIERAGSVIGKWRKSHHPEDVQAALKAAMDEQASNPVEYVTKILSGKKSKLPRALEDYSDSELLRSLAMWVDYYSTRPASPNRFRVDDMRAEVARRGLQI